MKSRNFNAKANGNERARESMVGLLYEHQIYFHVSFANIDKRLASDIVVTKASILRERIF